MKNIFSKSTTKIYLLFIIFISLITRFSLITRSSVWHDEGYTAKLVTFDFFDIIVRSANDNHPPLYHLLLKIWHTIFGYNLVSLRGFSVFCGILTIIVAYFLVRKLFNERIARISGIILAFAPFLIRYSDEMRMYSLVALFATSSTYALVSAINSASKRNKKLWWSIYSILILATIYAQYYGLFIVPAHLVYTYLKVGSLKQIITNKFWWLAHISIACLYLPWIPTLINQVTRVQSGFWIPPLTYETIPNTFSQFMTYTYNFPFFIKLAMLLVFVSTVIWFAYRNQKHRASIIMLMLWLFIPILAVSLLSLKQPVYQDRYFTYSSVAFYILLAVIIYEFYHINVKGIFLSGFVCAIVFLNFSASWNNLNQQMSHKMEEIGNYVSENYKQKDIIISAETYTYFDFDFYNNTNSQTKLLTAKRPSKYFETGLIYDNPSLYISDISSIKSGRVWLVGKNGDDKQYFHNTPSNWHLVDRFEAGDSAVQLYNITD